MKKEIINSNNPRSRYEKIRENTFTYTTSLYIGNFSIFWSMESLRRVSEFYLLHWTASNTDRGRNKFILWFITITGNIKTSSLTAFHVHIYIMFETNVCTVARCAIYWTGWYTENEKLMIGGSGPFWYAKGR